MSVIKIKDRGNIKVYNYTSSPVCMKGAMMEFKFEGAKDGIPSIIPVSFMDIEIANSKNTNMFVTGLLTFEESERDEIYTALGFPEWKERFWTEESIENALLYPTKAKMDKILAVRDILTIERIRGKMTHLLNTSIRRPIDTVVFLVNGRWNELLRGRSVSALEVMLPEDKSESERAALEAKNSKLEEEMRIMKEQIAALLAAQKLPESEIHTEKKSPGRPPKKAD